MGLFDMFGGGGASGSIGSSANTTTNKTDNKNNATSGDNAAIYDTRGGNISFQNTALDGGVIDRAFDFAGDAFARAATITTSAQERQDTAARDSLAAVVAMSANQAKSGVQGLTEDMFRWGVGALAVIAIAFTVTQKKRAA